MWIHIGFCFCDKRFGREENLKTHSKKHEGKNFFCGECEKHLNLRKYSEII